MVFLLQHIYSIVYHTYSWWHYIIAPKIRWCAQHQRYGIVYHNYSCVNWGTLMAMCTTYEDVHYGTKYSIMHTAHSTIIQHIKIAHCILSPALHYTPYCTVAHWTRQITHYTPHTAHCTLHIALHCSARSAVSCDKAAGDKIIGGIIGRETWLTQHMVR